MEEISGRKIIWGGYLLRMKDSSCGNKALKKETRKIVLKGRLKLPNFKTGSKSNGKS